MWQHIICLGFGLRLRPRTGLIRIQDVNSYLKEKMFDEDVGSGHGSRKDLIMMFEKRYSAENST